MAGIHRRPAAPGGKRVAAAMMLTATGFAMVRNGADRHEGLPAQEEKRAPRFTGA